MIFPNGDRSTLMPIASDHSNTSENDYPTDLSHQSVWDEVSLLVCWIKTDFIRAAGGNVAHHAYNALATLTSFACWKTGSEQRPITSDERDTLRVSFDQAEPRLRAVLATLIDLSLVSSSLEAIRFVIECWSMTIEKRFAVSIDSRRDTMDGVLLARNTLHNALLVGDVRARATNRILNELEKLEGSKVGQ